MNKRSSTVDNLPIHRGSKSSGKSSISSLNDNDGISARRESTRAQIGRMERARADRRLKAEQVRLLRAQEEKRNIANGNPGDIDFQRLISQFRESKIDCIQPHVVQNLKICVALRKRPVSIKEIRRKDHDSVSVFNPQVIVHNCKLKVDGITKYLDSNDFQFDHTFDGDATTAEVYTYTARPLIPFILEHGRATVFAYGQTGSGKTYTMMGIQQQAIDDLFNMLNAHPSYSLNVQVFLSFFEIYGGRCQDLLNSRHKLDVREDGQGDVHISGLTECQADSAEKLKNLVDRGNSNRTTHATESNDTSSRSHAICQISLKEINSGRLHGKLSLIDLAGSERGADTKSNNRQRRMEGAEINKSLLALKECIRALDSGESHVPYRGSKLTLVLKDSFTRRDARTVMIATVSPGASHSDHTINTLRYADRVKETKITDFSLLVRKEGITDSSVGAIIPLSPPVSPPGNSNSAESSVSDDEGKMSSQQVSDFQDDFECKNGPDSDNMVQSVFEEEEAILNLHMSIVQENAQLLTEEGYLLQQIQGDDVIDYDIDAYVTRLDDILDRKMQLMAMLKLRLGQFRRHLEDEERQSRNVTRVMQF